MIGIKSATLPLVALIVSGAAWLRAEDRMRAGLWEVTTQHNGETAGVIGKTSYTPAMVKTANMPANLLKETTEKLSTQRGCTIKSFKMDGNSMSMVKVCGGRTAAISSTYSGDAFDTVDTTTEGALLR